MNIHQIYRFLWKISGFRKRRLQLFSKFFNLENCKILDVGGTIHIWEMLSFLQNYPKVDIVLLNLRKPSEYEMRVIQAKKRYKFIEGNALSLPFKNKSFDIVFSNSLLDHLSSFDNQKKFAEEVKRVGKGYFIQTGNRRFFFEPHFLTPFVHYLPKKIQKKIIRNFTIWGLLTRPSSQVVNSIVDEIRFPTEKEFKALFPEALVIKEKFLFFTKSFVAVKLIPKRDEENRRKYLIKDQKV